MTNFEIVRETLSEINFKAFQDFKRSVFSIVEDNYEFFFGREKSNFNYAELSEITDITENEVILKVRVVENEDNWWYVDLRVPIEYLTDESLLNYAIDKKKSEDFKEYREYLRLKQKFEERG